MDEAGGDVVYFFDPAKALTSKEADFVLLAEKLMMILEQNPRLGGAVDLGQLDKLKDLKENKELEEMKLELVKRSRELLETQKALRKLQEDGLKPGFPWLKIPAAKTITDLYETIVVELEEKVSKLRSSSSDLKKQLQAETKD
eukprot:g4448.t1